MRRRKENLAAGDGGVPKRPAGRLDASDNNHIRRSNQFKPGPAISLRSKRFLTAGWPLLPFLFSMEPDGSLIISDRTFCPISRVDAGGRRQIWHPLLIRRCIEWHFLYSPHERPQEDPEMLEFILMATQVNGLEAEIIRRWHLSEEGRLPPHVWGQNWTWP